MPILIIKFNHTNLILSGHTMSLEIQVNVRKCDFKRRLNKTSFIREIRLEIVRNRLSAGWGVQQSRFLITLQ